MWCANCIQPVDGTIEHELCKEALWLAMSEEYTRTRQKFKNQYCVERKGETVEVVP